MIKTLAFFLIIFASNCFAQAINFKNITPKEAVKSIKTDSMIIVDARTPQEYAQGHLENAILIPVQIIQKDWKKLEEYKNRHILVYCRSGKRSATASKILIQKGFKKVYNLKGGIISWDKEKF